MPRASLASLPNYNRFPRYAPYGCRTEPIPSDLPLVITPSSNMDTGASRTSSAEVDDLLTKSVSRSEASGRPNKKKRTHKANKAKGNKSKTKNPAAPTPLSVRRSRHQKEGKMTLARRNATLDVLSSPAKRSMMQAKSSLARHDATLNVLLTSRNV